MKILAVGHAATVRLNQEPYAALLRLGADVHVIVPDRWRHELEPEPRPPDVHPDLEGRVHRARIAWPGAIQRHVHLTRPGRWIREIQPDVVLVDQECFSVPAAQWVRSSKRHGVPVAVSAWENLDHRPLPWPARVLRRTTLRSTTGVFARTPAAAQVVARWGATGPIHLVPPAVPVPPEPAAAPGEPFTVGFAGRLVDAKGIRDLLTAVDRLPGTVRLLAAGDGPLRELVAEHPRTDLRVGVRHDDMGALYEQMHVLVLPSRTTRTWSEQLGRVLLEAMAVGRPVIAAASGEMPWVLSEARGGLTFPEGDVDALVGLLADVRADPDRWRTFAEQGRQDVAERFSPEASAAALLELADALVAAHARQ